MKIKYTFADGEISEVEVNEEVGEFIIESRRQEENYERKERYHADYSIDAAEFEGSDLADETTPETEYVRLEEETEMSHRIALALDSLSEVQKRRFLQFSAGLSIREIARREGTNDKSVGESIHAARKQLQTFF